MPQTAKTMPNCLHVGEYKFILPLKAIIQQSVRWLKDTGIHEEAIKVSEIIKKIN